MTKIRLVLVLAAVMVLVGAAQVFAADIPPTPVKAPKGTGTVMAEQGGPEEGNFGIVGQLGLSEEQKTKIRGIMEATKEQRKTTMAARVEATNKLMQEALGGASEADIRAAAAEVGRTAGDHAVVVSKTWSEIKPILTPEQQTKLKELVAEKKEQRAEKRAEMREQVKEKAAERKAARTPKGTSEVSK
jgi:Spy/CpxP family protein refolding chaperone